MSPPCVFYSSSGYEWLVVVELQKDLLRIWHHWIGQKKNVSTTIKIWSVELSHWDPCRCIFFFFERLEILPLRVFALLFFMSGHAFLSRVETTRGIWLYMKLWILCSLYVRTISSQKNTTIGFVPAKLVLRLIKFLMNHTNVRVSCTVYYENIFYN